MKNLTRIIISLLWFFLFLNTFAINHSLPSTITNSWSANSWTQVSTFKLLSVDTIYNDEYKLTFSNDLYKDWLSRDIQINDISDAFATFNVMSTTVSWSTLNLKLESPLKTNREYEIIAIQIYDINLNNIEKWINASKIFKTPKVFDIKPIENNISITGSTSNINTWTWENNIELNAASDVNLNSIFKDLIPEKTTTTNKEIVNTLTTAKEAKKLPVTWPAEWLLLALALFFWLIILTFKTRIKN